MSVRLKLTLFWRKFHPRQKNNEVEEWRTKFYRFQDQMQDYEKKLQMAI